MKTVRIARVEQGADGTFGAVTIEGQAFCVCLELPWKNNEQNISCIPAGQYYCKLYESQRFGDTFEVEGVESRTHILFHPGNTLSDTEGCILLGQYWGKLRRDRAVLNSGLTFKQFMHQFRYEYGFYLEIEEIL